jgi:hypothetical protein
MFASTLLKVVLGLAAAVTVASPAAAATVVTPTISAPPMRTGYGTVIITGTVRPGATVRILESAYIWHDFQPGPTVRANSAGKYTFVRYVDTGFLFAVEADGRRSVTRTVTMKVLPTMSAGSARAGAVTVTVAANPAQPWLPVQVQRSNGNGTWTTVARGYTGYTGRYGVTLTNQGSGRTQTYRTWIGGDSANGMVANYSAYRALKVR